MRSRDLERSLIAAKDLLMGPLTAIFYDVTTLHFESELEEELRSKGSARTASTIGFRSCSRCW